MYDGLTRFYEKVSYFGLYHFISFLKSWKSFPIPNKNYSQLSFSEVVHTYLQ